MNSKPKFIIWFLCIAFSHSLEGQCFEKWVCGTNPQTGQSVIWTIAIGNTPINSNVLQITYPGKYNVNTGLHPFTSELVYLGPIPLTYVEIAIDCSCGMTFSITDPYGKDCTYVNGELCNDCPPVNDWIEMNECESIPSKCVDNFVNFLFENKEEVINTDESYWQYLDSYEGSHIPIISTESVSIGSNSFTNSALTVAEGIITDELQVSASNWADFVFDHQYPLRSIKQLEIFVNKYKHLPHFPNEETIRKDGLDVYEISRLQQISIEELFLYIIELEQELSSLEKLVGNE